jgi:exodeoxyribonuclease VII small subunit
MRILKEFSMTKKAKQSSFEDALNELEALVEQMESGDLSLDQSLAAFEKGVALTRQCQKALSEAELKVQKLTSADGEPEPFDDDA